MPRTRPLGPSLPDRRNFRSSPIYRALHERADVYAELLRYCRMQDHAAADGWARRAADRLRMAERLRHLDHAAHVAGFPVAR